MIMKFIISESQYGKLLNKILNEEENKEISDTRMFIEKFYEKYNRLPRYSELEQMNNKFVKDIYPEHPRSNSKISNWIKNYAPDFKNEITKIANEKNILISSNSPFGKVFTSFDGKHRFESQFESIFYNIFALENLQNELEYETREFLEDCGKIPDFYWRNKNVLIEIGGMTGEKYWQKLSGAKNCLESEGLEVVIFNVRKDQKKHDYIKFYKEICEFFGFQVRDEVIKDPSLIVDFREFTTEKRQEYIDSLIQKFDRTAGETDMLTKFLMSLGYQGIKDYKEKKDLGRYQTSTPGIRKEVVDLITKGNRIDDIAKILSDKYGIKISSNSVDYQISQAKKYGELPLGRTNKELFDKKREKIVWPDKEELSNLLKTKSMVQIGKQIGVSDKSVKKRAQKYGLMKKNEKN